MRDEFIYQCKNRTEKATRAINELSENYQVEIYYSPSNHNHFDDEVGDFVHSYLKEYYRYSGNGNVTIHN